MLLRKLSVLALVFWSCFTEFSSVYSQTISPTIEKPSDYLWDYRPLLLFGSNDQHTTDTQISLLTDQVEPLKERDIAYVTIIDDCVQTQFAPALNMSAKQLRNMYNIDANEFAVILVGRDGGVKLRKTEIVTPNFLYSLIDAMPMRILEMRQQDQ